MATGKQSPQSSLPPLSVKTVNTTTWGSGGNTCTISDEYVHTNSSPIIWVTGTTPAAGNWSWSCTQGTITITSSDAESSTLPLSYVVL